MWINYSDTFCLLSFGRKFYYFRREVHCDGNGAGITFRFLRFRVKSIVTFLLLNIKKI